jgi:hypothetical protein
MPMKSMTAEEFIEFLKEQQGDRTQKSFADSLGVSPQYLNDVYQRKQLAGDAITSSLGAERVVRYLTPVKEEEKE